MAVLLLAACSVPYDGKITRCPWEGAAPKDWFGLPLLTIVVRADASGPVDGEPPTLYEWDFGDGATATGVEVTHTSTATGEYEPRLTCCFSDGTTRTDTEIVSVAAAPVAAFLAELHVSIAQRIAAFFSRGTHAEENLEMSFDAGGSYPGADALIASEYMPVRMRWDFGDGQTRVIEPDRQVPGSVTHHQFKVHRRYATARSTTSR